MKKRLVKQTRVEKLNVERIHMKIIITAMMILFGTSLYADEGQSQLRTIETAKECAKEEKKLILLAFTGSDWCPPCKALKENIFDNEKFKAYAEANLVVVEVDFPRKQAKITEEQSICNSACAKQFSVKRLPTVIILNANGKRIGRHEGYSENTSVEVYIKSFLQDAREIAKADGSLHVGSKPVGPWRRKPDGEQGGKPVGPPNKVDGKDGKKPNREVLRKPGSKGGRKPSGEQGKKPSGEQGKKPSGEQGKKSDGEQGGERLNWKELLGLTDEQAKKFHAVMKKFREELEKINADKSLNPEKKMKARDSARKRRNVKLAQILTEEQMKKFRKIWRENARPNNAEGDDSSITPQQRAAMAKLMRWHRDLLKKILGSNLERAAKMKKIAQLKNIYRQKRSQILSPEQARAWAAKDGVSVSEGDQSAEGPDSGDRDQRGGKRDGKPDGERGRKPDGERGRKPGGERDGKPDSGCGFIPRSGDPTEKLGSN